MEEDKENYIDELAKVCYRWHDESYTKNIINDKRYIITLSSTNNYRFL